MVTIGLSRTISEINGDVRRKSNENRQFSHPPVYLTPPMKGFPVEFGIGVRGPKCLNDGSTRWSKKFSDRFSRFDTIPAVTRQPARQPASHVAVAITLNAKASSLKIENIGQHYSKVRENNVSCFFSAVFAVAQCPRSVTLMDYIQTAESIVKLLSRPDSPVTLVF